MIKVYTFRTSISSSPFMGRYEYTLHHTMSSIEFHLEPPAICDVWRACAKCRGWVYYYLLRLTRGVRVVMVLFMPLFASQVWIFQLFS